MQVHSDGPWVLVRHSGLFKLFGVCSGSSHSGVFTCAFEIWADKDVLQGLHFRYGPQQTSTNFMHTDMNKMFILIVLMSLGTYTRGVNINILSSFCSAYPMIHKASCLAKKI